jgi:hypothetical protein
MLGLPGASRTPESSSPKYCRWRRTSPGFARYRDARWRARARRHRSVHPSASTSCICVILRRSLANRHHARMEGNSPSCSSQALAVSDSPRSALAHSRLTSSARIWSKRFRRTRRGLGWSNRGVVGGNGHGFRFSESCPSEARNTGSVSPDDGVEATSSWEFGNDTNSPQCLPPTYSVDSRRACRDHCDGDPSTATG